MFERHFNQPIDSLPTSITHIEFGSDFNQPIHNLPHSITHLTLGPSFNQQQVLPPSLTHLSLIVGSFFSPTFYRLTKPATHGSAHRTRYILLYDQQPRENFEFLEIDQAYLFLTKHRGGKQAKTG